MQQGGRLLSRVALILASFFAAAALAGQTAAAPGEGGPTPSLGLPQHWKWHAGLSVGTLFSLHTYNGQTDFNFGVFRGLLFSDIEIAGLLAEGYVGFRAGQYDGGGRLLLAIPAASFGLGADWSSRDPRARFLLRVWLPLKRGGFLLRGAMPFVDWLPARHQTVRFGLSVPVWQKNVGRTRPAENHVSLEKVEIRTAAYSPGGPGLEPALAALRDHGRWINRLAIPFFDAGGPDVQAVAGEIAAIKARLAARDPRWPGFGADHEAYAFDDALEEAFGSVAAPGTASETDRRRAGRRVGGIARDILFTHVLAPYDRLLGQEKRADTTTSFASQAGDAFARWLVTESGLPADRHAGLIRVFHELLTIVEAARADSARRWGNSRLVWLPLQYAVSPDQVDRQAELDSVLGRLAGAEMTDGNEMTYILNDQFQWELLHSIQDARDYHVLWVHDFRGLNDRRKPDKVAFEQIARGYLPAMIKHVQEYDQTGRYPLYLIFLDQHYYELRRSRRWMSFLADPLDDPIRLPGAPEMERELRDAQEKLRRAVGASRLLQEQIRQHGRAWLGNFIGVKVNITNPADSSFRVRLMAPLIGIPDNVMRDHRKLVLYDVGEDDPYRGEVIYTGMGVGEDYASGYWEDRGLIVRGPDNLRVKRAARDLLKSQGFADDQIPYPLRPSRRPPYYDAMVQDHISRLRAQGGRPARLLDVQNVTGCGQKDVNIVRSGLYNLLPAGTLLAAPDSLWINFLYAGLLVGDALRGLDVWIIAPSLAASPAPGQPETTRSRTLLSRLLIIRRELEPEMAAARGSLRVGIYNPAVSVGDVAGRLLAMSQTFRSVPFLRSFYSFTEDVAFYLTRTAEVLKADNVEAAVLADQEARKRAKLHLKANFAMSGGAFRKLIARPEWQDYLQRYVLEQSRLVTEKGAYRDPRLVSSELERQSEGLFRQFQSSLTPEEQAHAMIYLLMGTANMDYRSMITDGDAMVLCSGLPALSPLLDFAELEGLSRWIETKAELDALIPPAGGLGRFLARWEKLAL